MQKKYCNQEYRNIRRLTNRDMIIQSAKEYFVDEAHLFNFRIHSEIIYYFKKYLNELNLLQDEIESEIEVETEPEIDSINQESQRESIQQPRTLEEQTLIELNNYWCSQESCEEVVIESEILPFENVPAV